MELLRAEGSVMRHNPALAASPDLPNEILYKISSMAKIVAPSDAIELPKAEPECNCPHCQIARALQVTLGKEKESDPVEVEEEEIVKDEELVFEQWKIEEKGDHLYTVTNKLDEDEQYNVFLGTPIGCTCGKEGCDHIVAVLRHE